MSTTSAAAYGTGTGMILIGGLSLSDWAIVIGIACTIGTFAINWYYKRKEFQLMQDQAHIDDVGEG